MMMNKFKNKKRERGAEKERDAKGEVRKWFGRNEEDAQLMDVRAQKRIER